MPKKTRREKIAAANRRHIILLEKKPDTEKTTELVMPDIDIQPVKPVDDAVRKYFFSDLKKSLILISSMIVLEFILYAVKIVK